MNVSFNYTVKKTQFIQMYGYREVVYVKSENGYLW